MSGHDKHVRNELKRLARQLRAASDEAASYEPSSFEKRSQLLRDLSGLCRKGMLRLAWCSVERQVEQRTLERLRAHPQVENFLNMAREMPVDQLEDLSRLVLQELLRLTHNHFGLNHVLSVVFLHLVALAMR